MEKHSKHIQKQLRHLADLLYERELNEALARLDVYFAEWRNGKISPFLLSKKIHEFHQGEARELYGKYVGNQLLDLLVARGGALGKMSEKEVLPEVWEVVQLILVSMENREEEE